MTDLQRWLDQEWKEARPIFWVAENIKDYHAIDGNTKVLEEITQYSQNIYTYATEASRAYHKLYRKCCNNPIIQQCPYLMRGRYSIICENQKNYLVEVQGEEKSYIVPMGLLDEAPKEYRTECMEVKSTVERTWKLEFHKTCEKAASRLKAIQNECYHSRTEINKLCTLGNIELENSRIHLAFGMLIGIVCLIIMYCMRKIWESPMVTKIQIVYTVFCAVLLCGYGLGIYRKIGNISYNKRLSMQLETYEKNFQDYQTKLNKNSDVNLELNQMLLQSVKALDFLAIDQAIAAADAIIKTEAKKACTKEEFIESKKKLKVWIIVLLIQVVLLFFANQKMNRMYGRISETTAAYEEEMGAELAEESLKEQGIFDENGFVFPDSNERYLTEEEVYALNDAEEYDFQTLLGHARNEIYARHGYAFNENGIYYPFYMEYDWSRNMEHHVVSDSELNEYEQANRDLIVAIERKEGYRK